MNTVYKSQHITAGTTGNEHRKAYLVGAGIPSLASAAYLIRDGHFTGSNIFIIGESAELGGSMDAHRSPEHGYIMRGGRMFDDEVHTCTYDLLSFIPSLDLSSRVRSWSGGKVIAPR
jgi:oleate hydratase